MKKLISLLTNQEHFNWDTWPVTTVSKKDKLYIKNVKGGYGPGYCSVDAGWRAIKM